MFAVPGRPTIVQGKNATLVMNSDFSMWEYVRASYASVRPN